MVRIEKLPRFLLCKNYCEIGKVLASRSNFSITQYTNALVKPCLHMERARWILVLKLIAYEFFRKKHLVHKSRNLDNELYFPSATTRLGSLSTISRRLHFGVLYGKNEFQNQFSRI